MSERLDYPESHPCYHTARIKQMLNEVKEHARQDVTKIDEPKAQALFETTAEVLNGLITAYEHYERAAEPAWK
jgi:hypothetical protein